MSRPRWTQFSLRFLFAATLLAASVAWWFRPGIVKPEFQLERFSQEIESVSGKKLYFAHIRLINSGWDSRWLMNDYDCRYEMDMEESGEVSHDGNEIVFSGGIRSKFDASPLRLKYRDLHLFKIELDKGARSIKIGVDLADRRKRRTQTYWSQAFAIPNDLFSSPMP